VRGNSQESNRKDVRVVTPPSDHRQAVAAGFLGWMLDAFDFFLVVFCLTAIGKEFHKPDAAIALSITVTLAFRPVGAFIFGLLADRYGRRLPLMLDLVFYSIVEVLTAFAPNYTTFMVLRALFGIGMGGEWGVGASLAMEKVPARLRGLLSGLLQQGYAAGNLLAAIGPAIGGCCYEVGTEVAAAFLSQFAEAQEWFDELRTGDEPNPLQWLNQFPPGHQPPPKNVRLDLRKANSAQLIAAGVSPQNIFTSELCTACGTDLLFSYRKAGKESGRMMAAIGIRRI